jgi:site-specific recombinase XerD
MKGQGPKGVDALMLAPLPRVPVPHRQLIPKRLADHIPSWLFWMQYVRGRSPNTIRAYGEDARMFVAFCERLDCPYAEQVTHHVIEGFTGALRVGLGQKETSIARRRHALVSLFVYLEREGVVPKNPAKLAMGMKVPPRPPANYMTKTERDKVLTVLSGRDSRRGRRNYAMFSLMFLSGLRVSEVCQLKVTDVDLEAQSLYIRAGKGNKDRRVPMPGKLTRILRGWITTTRSRCVGADSPWLFLHMQRHHQHDGQPLNPKAIYHQVRNQIVPILGRKVTPHSFRHSYGTHIWEESGDLRLTQHLMGRASANTTAIYTHVTPRKEREKLAEYLK